MQREGGVEFHVTDRGMMRKSTRVLLVYAVAFCIGAGVVGCERVTKMLSEVGLSEEEIVQGLRAALDVSAKTSASDASKENGFLLNDLIRIAAPQEVVELQKTLEGISSSVAAASSFRLLTGQSPNAFLEGRMENLVSSINHAAEEAAQEAYPIFKKAITEMTITDGLGILQGGKTAATDYLRSKTFDALVQAFTKPVRGVIAKGEVSQLWRPVVEKYNMVAPLISGVSFLGYTFTGPKSVNPDLSEYITERAMDGLFKLVAREEQAIRANPKHYASDIIQRVFGSVEARGVFSK